MTETTINGAWAYSYDDDGQLVHAVFKSTNPAIANQDLQYVYDAAGNRVSTAINGITTAYVTNNLNQYTSVGTAALSYDADGNLTSDGAAQYTYDDQNRLVKLVTASDTWTFEYDPFGNLIATVHDGQRTENVVDPTGVNYVAATYNGSGALLDHYTQGFGLVSQVSPSRAAGYYDFDASGSTAGVSGSSGAYENSYSYLPFGGLLASQESIANPFQFGGQLGANAAVGGLDHMGARDYAPAQGRFTSTDPLGLAGGGINDYTIRQWASDPVDFADPTGKCFVCAAILIGYCIDVATTAYVAGGVFLEERPAVDLAVDVGKDLATAAGSRWRCADAGDNTR